MFDYKLLQALDAVVREGGFDRAASRLHVTQSAVSQRIRQLEDRLGQILVVRSSPAQATEAGRQLLGHFERVQRMEGDLLGVLEPGAKREPIALAVGVNADTLGTWLMRALSPFLRQENIVLELVVDDQDRTHDHLRNGVVAGCVSSRPDAMQGCRCVALGRMDYYCVASPQYAGEWFPSGLSTERILVAPAVLFNRKDEVHDRFLEACLGASPGNYPRHYVPSTESFVDFLLRGHAYGMAPDLQVDEYVASGQLVDLAPGHCFPVALYWHQWGLESGVLKRLQQALQEEADKSLKRPGAP